MSTASPSPPAALAAAHSQLDDARKAYDITPNSHTRRAVTDAEQACLSALAAADTVAERLLSTVLAPRLPPALLTTFVSAMHRPHFGALAQLADNMDYPMGVMTALRHAWRRHHHREAGEDLAAEFARENGFAKIAACATFGDAVLILQDQYQVNDVVFNAMRELWRATHKKGTVPLLISPFHPRPTFQSFLALSPPLRSSVPPDYCEPYVPPPAAPSRAAPSASVHPAFAYEDDYANEPGSSTDSTADAASTPGAHSAQSPAGEDGRGDADDGRAPTPTAGAHVVQSPAGGSDGAAGDDDAASSRGGGADDETVEGGAGGGDEDSRDGDAESNADSPREGR
ncbi:hypothetical protein C8R45DRAFT_1090435 [Mycena sanguinolenta]|nr:hypothetical protein C8R45DRAFT_1090435 [Mycena sanguinolenta]